mgnify:CR=1 FL=1
MDLIINTSGSTAQPKTVHHNHKSVQNMLERSIRELQLTQDDIVLNVYPSNVIAYYAITGLPAITAGSQLASIQWNAWQYIDWLHEIRPTVISLIPPQINALMQTKSWVHADFSSVRYCVTGSQNVHQSIIDALLQKGVTTVGNWYGSTEYPPPLFVGYNSVQFNFTQSSPHHSLTFNGSTSCSELLVDGKRTDDFFDLRNNTFICRGKEDPGFKTWKK